MITEYYVSYEVAKLLKEKGFNERSIASYDSKGQLQEGYGYWNKTPIWCAAPTHQMAMAWLRETHNIFIDVHLSFAEDPDAYPAVYYVYILDAKSGNSLLEKAANICELNPLMNVNDHNILINFDSPEEAIEAALKYTLENLI